MTTVSYYRAESWWHRERDKRLLSMRESGASIEEIAAAMQLSIEHVNKILKFYRERSRKMNEINSSESVLKKLGLDQYSPEELALMALDEVRRLCKGKKWQMTIPVKGNDSDIVISEAIQALLRQVSLFEVDRAFHPRAAKLMQKHKNFLVVAEDENYFEQVYNLIRDGEMNKGTWTIEDENLFKDAIAKNRKLLIREKR